MSICNSIRAQNVSRASYLGAGGAAAGERRSLMLRKEKVCCKEQEAHYLAHVKGRGLSCVKHSLLLAHFLGASNAEVSGKALGKGDLSQDFHALLGIRPLPEARAEREEQELGSLGKLWGREKSNVSSSCQKSSIISSTEIFQSGTRERRKVVQRIEENRKRQAQASIKCSL